MVRGRYSPTEDHGDLDGLTDDDHTQYIKDSELSLGTGQGQMLFWRISFHLGNKWVNTEITELRWDDTNKRLGINKVLPTSTLDVGGTATMTRLLVGGITE